MVGDLGLKGGLEMYIRYISLQENRKNMQKIGDWLHAPAISPGSGCDFEGKEGAVFRKYTLNLCRGVVTGQVGVTDGLSHQPQVRID